MVVKTAEEKKKEGFLQEIADRATAAVQLGLEPISKRLKELEDVAELDESLGRDHDLPGSAEATHKGESFSYIKVINAVSQGNTPETYEKHAPLEWEMSKALLEKERNRQGYTAQATNDDGLGGFLIPSQVMRDTLLEILQPSLITGRLGMTEMFDLTGRPVELPRVVEEPEAEAVAEGQGTPTRNAEFGMFKLEPHEVQVYMVAARTFLANSTPDGESYMRGEMVKALAKKYNDFALTGTGGDGEPRGLLNQSGLQTHDWVDVGSDVSAAYGHLLSMEGLLVDASVLEDTGATLRWLNSPAFIRGLRQMKSENATTGTESLEINRKVFSAAAEDKVLGYNYVQTPRMITTGDIANNDLVLGDFSRMIFAMWGSMNIEASNVAGDALRLRQTHFVANTEVDFGVTHPEAFCTADNLNLTGL